MSRARVKKKCILKNCERLGIPRWKVLTRHWFDGKKYFKKCVGYIIGSMWEAAKNRTEIDLWRLS